MHLASVVVHGIPRLMSEIFENICQRRTICFVTLGAGFVVLKFPSFISRLVINSLSNSKLRFDDNRRTERR